MHSPADATIPAPAAPGGEAGAAQAPAAAGRACCGRCNEGKPPEVCGALVSILGTGPAGG